MTKEAAILMSTFEPSGDAMAARVIREVRRQHPALRIYALGGDAMAAAGAEVVEHTTQRGSMFLDTLAQARSHQRRLRRLAAWMQAHRIDAFIPVDSPAGNWSLCRMVRRLHPEARIVHLVAPQVWAWAPWRVRKLRRLTDHVLCLLPFEPDWFAPHGVEATFVGHPVFEQVSEAPSLELSGSPRLALLPGSRMGEVTRNWPTMMQAFRQLKRVHGGLCGAVAALDDRMAQVIREHTPRDPAGADGDDWPQDLEVVSGRTEAVLDWCEVVLVASGTATLQVTQRRRPMVIMYNMSWLAIAAMGWMVRTRIFTLPNLVSRWAGQGRAVPELVPHFGQVEPVVRHLRQLLGVEQEMQRQRDALEAVAGCFDACRFSVEAPRRLIEMAHL